MLDGFFQNRAVLRVEKKHDRGNNPPGGFNMFFWVLNRLGKMCVFSEFLFADFHGSRLGENKLGHRFGHIGYCNHQFSVGSVFLTHSHIPLVDVFRKNSC